MTEKAQEKILRERELAFFGAVTASISHDLNNAIAIIEQTAGLLEDLILECDGEQAVSKEQLTRIVERIEKQTKRGATIVRRLNAFAHSVDESQRELELNDLIKTVDALAHRIADSRRIKLEPQPSEEKITIRSSPFRVQQAVYLSIKEVVTLAREGAQVTISTRALDSSAMVTVEGPVGDAPNPDLSYLEMLMTQLGGEVESTGSDGKITVLLTFPR